MSAASGAVQCCSLKNPAHLRAKFIFHKVSKASVSTNVYGISVLFFNRCLELHSPILQNTVGAIGSIYFFKS